MKTIFLSLIFIVLSISTPFAEKQKLSSFNAKTDAFLKKYVKDGKVDYRNLKTNFNDIETLYKSLSNVDIASLSKDETKAFYINAYNIIVIRQITEFFPLKSALDKNGFFDKVKHNVGGEVLTLDQIEKGKVIIPFRDPRVHFAFSCAAIGCPELADFAFTSENIEQQLEERTKNAINNPDFIIISDSEKKVKLSMIFKWYERDFKIDAESVTAYINKYRKSPLPASYEITHYEYDWSLNIQ